MTDYDKMIEIKKKELAKVTAQIGTVSAELSRKIKEGNTVIYDNKAKAEKIISDANEKATEIMATAGKIKASAEAMADQSTQRSKELDEKERNVAKTIDIATKSVEKLSQDRTTFEQLKKEKLANVETILAKARELVDIIVSQNRTVATKIAEITKI